MALAAINVKKTARSANIHEQKRITLEKTPSTNGKPNKNNSADLERLPDAPLGRGAQRGIVRCSARGRIVQLGHDVYGRSPDLCRLRLRSHGLCQFLYGPPRTARRQRRQNGQQTGRRRQRRGQRIGRERRRMHHLTTVRMWHMAPISLIVKSLSVTRHTPGARARGAHPLPHEKSLHGSVLQVLFHRP